MRQIYFTSSDGGTWGGFCFKGPIPFLKILQQAKGLESATGLSVRVILNENNTKESDITEWIYKKAGY